MMLDDVCWISETVLNSKLVTIVITINNSNKLIGKIFMVSNTSRSTHNNVLINTLIS